MEHVGIQKHSNLNFYQISMTLNFQFSASSLSLTQKDPTKMAKVGSFQRGIHA